MVNTLSGSVCAYRKETVKPRFIRIDEVMALLDVTQDEAMDIALAAGARYQLAKIILVHKERLMKFMKHSARVPSSNKIVERKLSQRSQPKLEARRQTKILPRLKIQKRRLIKKITDPLIMKLLQSREKSQSRMTSLNRKLLQVVIRKLVEIRVMQVMVVRLQTVRKTM